MRGTNYGLSRAMDSIGVQGGSIPGLAPGGMVPTIQLADLTNNFASQVFESRGLSGNVFTGSGVIDEILVWALSARSPGGTVVEDIQVHTNQLAQQTVSGPPNGTWVMELSRSNLSPGTTADYSSIGGGDPNNLLFHGSRTWLITEWDTALPPDYKFGGLNIWIPPGSFLNLGLASYRGTAATNPVATVCFSWREIPEIQGVAE